MTCDMERKEDSFQKFCEALALKPEQITSELKAFYEEAEQNGELDCDTCVSAGLINQLQEKYELFPILLGEVLHGAEVIRQDASYLKYTNILRLCVKNKQMDKYIPFIQAEKDNVAVCFAPLFAVLAYVEEAEAEMCRRGIPKEVRLSVHKAYEKMVLKRKNLFGFSALTSTYYFWSRHYIKPDIYPIGELEFEITSMHVYTMVLENVKDGSLWPIREWKECGSYFEGKPIQRGGSLGEEQQFLSEEYRGLLQPGDDILSVHIPRNAHIDGAHYRKDYQSALEFFAEYYPEKHIKAITCHSWLMDPELSECVKASSNIMDFQHYYHVCPFNSSGKEVFSFVFYKPVQDYKELPENTSLERALKKRYLDDNPIYAYLGVHML